MANPVFVTNDNLTPAVQILLWFLLVTSVCGVIGRGLTKAALIRSVGLDDALTLVALIFSIGQSVAVSIETDNGLGQPAITLASSQIVTVLKAAYAAELLYIPALCFAKLAVLALVAKLTPARRDKYFVYGIGMSILAWAVSAEVVAGFQCRPPTTYDYIGGSCINRTAWMNYLEISNIVTDLALVALPILVIWKVKTSTKRKLSVLSFFVIRISIPAASISKLIFLNRTQSLPPPIDPTFSPWPVVVCTQTIVCLEILAVCVLYLRPLLGSLESGFIGGGDLRRRGEAGWGYDGHSGSSQRRHPSYPLTDRGARKSHGGGSSIGGVLNKFSKSRSSATAERVDPGSDRESQHSRSQIIRETRTWTVQSSVLERASSGERAV